MSFTDIHLISLYVLGLDWSEASGQFFLCLSLLSMDYKAKEAGQANFYMEIVKYH